MCACVGNSKTLCFHRHSSLSVTLTYKHTYIEYKYKNSASLHTAVYSTAIPFQSNFKWRKTFLASPFSFHPPSHSSLCALFFRFTSMHFPWLLLRAPPSENSSLLLSCESLFRLRLHPPTAAQLDTHLYFNRLFKHFTKNSHVAELLGCMESVFRAGTDCLPCKCSKLTT